MQEVQVQSLGWEDPPEEEMTTHSSILAWKILWTEESGGLQSMGLLRVRHDLETKRQQQQDLPGGFLQRQIVGPSPRISDSISLGRLRICFSDKLSASAEAAGWGATLWEPAGLQGACQLHPSGSFCCWLWGIIGDVVSLLSGPQHFGVCILGGKKKAFVSERWTCIFLGLSFGPWYLCTCNEFSVLSCKEKEIVDQIRASCWCLVYRDWGKLQWGIGVDPDYLSNKLRDSVYIALDFRILKFYCPSNQICCIQKMWGTVWVNSMFWFRNWNHRDDQWCYITELPESVRSSELCLIIVLQWGN